MSLSETKNPVAAAPRQRAVIYSRVSSLRQVEDGHGLESQEARCREYARRMNYEILEAFHEKGIEPAPFDRTRC